MMPRQILKLFGTHNFSDDIQFNVLTVLSHIIALVFAGSTPDLPQKHESSPNRDSKTKNRIGTKEIRESQGSGFV